MVDSHVSTFQRLFDCSQPVALVTGSGAPRIGNHVAHDLGRRGFHVYVHAHRSRDDAQATVERFREEGVQADALFADLSKECEVERLFQELAERSGRLDVLVNCAATWAPKKLEDITADDVTQQLSNNTLSTFLCAQRAGLMMVPQETGGVIVNLGDWAIVRPYLDYAHYFPSKGAIPAMTRSLAVELAHRNPRIRVNAILPGPAMLPNHLDDATRAAAVAGTLVRREGSPFHIALAVRFLIENDFVTGVCVPVDGGRSIFAASE